MTILEKKAFKKEYGVELLFSRTSVLRKRGREVPEFPLLCKDTVRVYLSGGQLWLHKKHYILGLVASPTVNKSNKLMSIKLSNSQVSFLFDLLSLFILGEFCTSV